MNEIKNNQKKYEIVAKYIKDISFEIPSPDSFVNAAENLGLYSTKLDLSSKPFKNNLAELNCKFLLEAPDNIKDKIHAEVCISIVFKLIDSKMNADEIKKTILISIPNENFEYMKDIVTTLFQKSGFKNFKFNKPIDFEDLYKKQFTI
ncbi:MAG: protein-export protein SecB [Pelagibacteraceae bacterium TMED136]|nr:MAG: protein-export protein SecB [Pelagibacteraceae bacterium TMED136]|tara:strand:+ start:372 stop:815 length:444 start_codon:yes stop_codon:yes gene_type:complete